MRKELRMVCLLLVLGLLFGCGESAADPRPSSETVSLAPGSEAPAPAETTVEEVVIGTPQETELPTLPPTPTPTPTPIPTPFGIVWLPDTQALAYSHPDRLEALGAEIAARREPEHIAAVVHTGDIVDNGFKEEQWENFDLCLSAFENDLPFYPVAGNHDIGVKVQKYDPYLARPFLEKLPEGQVYEGGKMYYILLNEGGVELLLLGVGWECGRTEAERAWIDEVFAQYPGTPCILFTHAFLKPDGTVFPKSQYLEDNIVASHPNVRLVICGHSRDSSKATKGYDDDGDGEPERTVTMLMLNRQGKQFAYRVLRIDPLARSIEVKTYAIGKSEPLEKDDNYPLSFLIENAF